MDENSGKEDQNNFFILFLTKYECFIKSLLNQFKV